MEGRRHTTSLLPHGILLCWLAHSIAGDTIETCTNSDSSFCSASQRRARTTLADYSPDLVEDDQEDVNDADMNMHLQTRLNVDIPLDSQAGAAKQHEETQKVDKSPAVQEIAAQAPLKDTVAAGQPPVAPVAAKQEAPRAVPMAVAPRAAALAGMGAADTPFNGGNQLLLGAAAGAFLVIAGLLSAICLRKFVVDRKGKVQDRMRAAAQAWMLDWALGYEPDDDEEAEVEVEAMSGEMTMKVKKKQPPMAAESDSGDTDEEEPEAESDTADMLEDAVYVAEQVEVANNQAVDSSYGVAPVSRDDQIFPDLR